MIQPPAPPVAAIAARKPVAAIGDRGCVPALGRRGHLSLPAHRRKSAHAPSLRGCHMGICLALLIVLQLKADNIQPLQATVTGPSAVLVKSTNTFTVAITGGERPYIVEWWQGVTRLAVNSNMGYASSAQYSYIAPDNPRHETLTAFVSDARSNPCPRETSADCSFWQVRFDLDVDATYDGTIDDADERVETTQGGLLALNADDDNRNGTADLNETTVASEDDLCRVAVVLAPQNVSGSSLTLSATAGGGKIRAWPSSDKSGTPFTLPYTWQPGAQPEYVYVEGIQTSGAKCDIGLKLALATGNTTLNDEIRLGVVKVEFTNRTDTAYGYDDGSRAYPAPNPAHYTPQKYSWASVKNRNGQTKIDAKITPAVYANSVFFAVDDTAKAACSPARATTSPQILNLTGKGIAQKSQTFLRAYLGSATGPYVAQINLAVYQCARLASRDNITFYKIRTATLIPDGTTWGQLTNDANALLCRGVACLDGQDGGIKIIEYDLNTNGYLDMTDQPAPNDPEWHAIINAINPQSGGRYVLHIQPLIKRPGGFSAARMIRYLSQDWVFFIITDGGTTDKSMAVAHEMLHHLKLSDVGPVGFNSNNIMYYSAHYGMRDLHYFPVWRHDRSQTEHQWETIYRGY